MLKAQILIFIVTAVFHWQWSLFADDALHGMAVVIVGGPLIRVINSMLQRVEDRPVGELITASTVIAICLAAGYYIPTSGG